MPVHKGKNRKKPWYYEFDLPGATRLKRDRASASGFATKREAEDAEVLRHIEEQQKREMVKAGAGVVAEIPKTLAMLMEEFFGQHVDRKLAPKTVERYHEQAAYLHPELLAMPLAEITPLHLDREWRRLQESGGHHRRTKVSRPRRSEMSRASFPVRSPSRLSGPCKDESGSS